MQAPSFTPDARYLKPGRAGLRWSLGLTLATAALAAQAVGIRLFSPQGEVARISQVVVQMDAAAVRFGDPKAQPPVTLQCNKAEAARGTGRWNSDKEWVFDFSDSLPPGISCTAHLNKGFKTPSGAELTGSASYQFQTGGPQVADIQPSSYESVDEQQYFALRLTGPATAQSLQQSVWCTGEGVGERIPVKLIEGKERDAVLEHRRWSKEAAKSPQQYVVLACNRRLTAGSKMQLVYGKGVRTPDGIASRDPQRYEYQVQEPFTAEFNCERENAQAACLPIRPMRLSFNAPVPRKLVEGIRLQSGASAVAPRLDDDDKNSAPDSLISSVSFAPTMQPEGKYRIELPPQFKDGAGRPLANADMFPLAVATGRMPPLVKFAAAPFGIIERYAEGPDGPALLPVTVRNVEAQLSAQALGASLVRTRGSNSDSGIIDWMRRVEAFNESDIRRSDAARVVKGPLPKAVDDYGKEYVQSRMLSLLKDQPEVKALAIPKSGGQDPRPFEVIGVPLPPGFHVVEIASPLLGQSLLDENHGAGRTMYVRTSVLVTNLAVHFKLGRENSIAWVTTLDKGKPVPGAKVQVSDCNGNLRATAVSDASGVARFADLDPAVPKCATSYYGQSWREDAYFVSARADLGKGEELAFVWSNWQRGIEPWRFNLPTDQSARPSERVHTVFDRTLLRAGETVSMKHFIRRLTGPDGKTLGFGLPEVLPDTVRINHWGSGQKYEIPLTWRKTRTGGLSAASEFAIPKSAKLGQYGVTLVSQRAGGRSFGGGDFRVEDFRLPVMQGRVGPADKQPLFGVRSLPVEVQLNYVAGGAAAGLPVAVSAAVSEARPDFGDWNGFSFDAPRKPGDDGNSDDEEATASANNSVVANKLPVTLDGNGLGKVKLDNLPTEGEPRTLRMEATYSDPNGEVQTISSTRTLWPAAVVAGVRAEHWVSVDRKLSFQALALDTDGKAQAGVPLKVEAMLRTTTTSRKRLVGGFYSYDNQTSLKSLGTVCSGASDVHGLLQCEAQLSQPGEIELVVTASDKENRASRAAATVWVTRAGELWFGGEDHDRMDVLPELRSYEPGETARLQVRMPFRSATALVAVEREGIVSTQVVELRGDNPTVELKVQPEWGPNVYVSVLALRGRLREVPWYSFFTWGFKSPREWWTAFWHEGKQYIAPTALVDLSKPAFRFGAASIRVGTKAHRLDVKLATDQASYKVRSKARVKVKATLPDGKPAAGAEIAFAAVDQALLELRPNDSWQLLEAMLAPRSWGVSTATAQMEIVGRRHYGRKAVPAGGGGGSSNTRELLDTLLLWKPDLVLDANGEAEVEVPLNDALTTFQAVAVADYGVGLFGTGKTAIRVTQDLQIISGLPPLVREDDQFRAQVTVRNTSAKPMKVEVAPRATLLELKLQTVDIPAGEAREVAWDVQAPAQLAGTRVQSLIWEIAARDVSGGANAADAASDALKISQRIVPAVPLSVQQATMVQLDGEYSLPVAPPADALPGRGGLQMSLVPRLSEGLPGVRDWWARYPYSCLEQQTSKAVGMNEPQLWQEMMGKLPNYLDSDGLANYFPVSDPTRRTGSDALTAHLVNLSALARGLDKRYVIPDAELRQMELGLAAFVEGRIKREFWSPVKDLEMRKIAAIAALAAQGHADVRMLDSINIAPNTWPTHTVIDWVLLLQRMPQIAQRDDKLAQAMQILRARLIFNGTRAGFSSEKEDNWWWLMQGPDVNLARLILAMIDAPEWKDDLPRLVSGFLTRQQGGAWHTTTANLWGALALQRFSQKFESAPVTGITTAVLGTSQARVDWSQVARAKPGDAQGQPHASSFFGEPARAGLLNNTMLLPWGDNPKGGQLKVAQDGTGRPWLTVQSVAAVALKAPFSSGYSVQRTVEPLEQASKSLPEGQYSRGDVLRVTLRIKGNTDMTWVAVTDPIPSGATILGGGLGRDSAIVAGGEKSEGDGWLAYEERSFEAYRAYYQYLPRGEVKLQYTMRLNNAGQFKLPPTRVEALYAPEMFGEAPSPQVRVVLPKL